MGRAFFFETAGLSKDQVATIMTSISFAFLTFSSTFQPSADSAFVYFFTLQVLMHLICGGVGGGTNAPSYCGPIGDNVAAAGRALVFTSSVPWLICGGVYSSLHYFYPRDMDRIFERRRLENEAAGAALGTELVNS